VRSFRSGFDGPSEFAGRGPDERATARRRFIHGTFARANRVEADLREITDGHGNFSGKHDGRNLLRRAGDCGRAGWANDFVDATLPKQSGRMTGAQNDRAVHAGPARRFYLLLIMICAASVRRCGADEGCAAAAVTHRTKRCCAPFQTFAGRDSIWAGPRCLLTVLYCGCQFCCAN